MFDLQGCIGRSVASALRTRFLFVLYPRLAHALQHLPRRSTTTVAERLEAHFQIHEKRLRRVENTLRQ